MGNILLQGHIPCFSLRLRQFVNVKVAVRVRPFNEREVDAKARPCVYMSGKTLAFVNKQ